MCSSAVFEEGVDILLRAIDQTHQGQQYLLNAEEPALIVLGCLELVLREGKEVSRRFIRQHAETASVLLHKLDQVLRVPNADRRLFELGMEIAELFYQD
ncbi:unnamed protein product, partial [Amoebophrya sp. A25]|eukprot:GSA25T00000173001.1